MNAETRLRGSSASCQFVQGVLWYNLLRRHTKTGKPIRVHVSHSLKLVQ